MKVLIVGGGGREHALAWKTARSPRVKRVYVAPGNAGTAREPGVENVPLGAEDLDALVDFARQKGIQLTLVGPEAPLVAGVVDRFRAAGLACLGPTAAAARLEGSKAFAKAFMERHGIPTARHAVFTELDAALAHLRHRGAPVVIKADGLAAGKGVVVARRLEEAEAAVRAMLGEGRFGEAGRRVVVEDCLEGEEASFIALVDGEHVLPLASSQDHKPLLDGDRGPNTGGMGAYSPAPVVTEAVHRRVMEEVMLPAVRGMAEEGHPYIGFLYAGLMIAPDGSPRVLEFNCRLGDPEAQPLLMRLESDLTELAEAALEGGLGAVEARWDRRAALGVVLAAAGYPERPRLGDPIEGLEGPWPEGIRVFHAGTAERNGRVVTAGGRVLCVCALGENVGQARCLAYEQVGRIRFEGMHYRHDIGRRALERSGGPGREGCK